MNQRTLWPRNKIIADEIDIPAIPHLFWRSSRRDYENSEPVSAILMAGLAIESGVNEYASQWMNRMYGIAPSVAMKFLEESLDFRRIVDLLWCLGEFNDQLRKDLHGIYNERNKYAHMQTSKILGKSGDEEVEFRDSDGRVTERVKIKEADYLAAAGILANADNDARNFIEQTESSLLRLFGKNDSGYWKRLVWGVEHPTKIYSDKEEHNP